MLILIQQDAQQEVDLSNQHGVRFYRLMVGIVEYLLSLSR